MATTLIGDPSVVLAASGSLAHAEQMKFQKELQSYLYSLPGEIGIVLQTTDHGPQTTEKALKTVDHGLWTMDPFVIHLQDAHANPEAQRNIYEILKFLSSKYPDLAVGVEGSSGPLHPEYLDLFVNSRRLIRRSSKTLRPKGN